MVGDGMIPRTFLLVLNGAIALVFAGLFIFTLAGKSHIDRMARSFASEKTLSYARPTVETVDRALKSEISRKLLTAKQLEKTESEIAEFRREPEAYVRQLVLNAPRNRLDRSVAMPAGHLNLWKQKVRDYYDRVVDRLLLDLKIFFATNAIAGTFAFALAYRSEPRPQASLQLCSLLLLISIGLTSYCYVDSFTFFNMMSDGLLGRVYPALLAAVFFWLLKKFPWDAIKDRRDTVQSPVSV
jgi:hypothetical protein